MSQVRPECVDTPFSTPIPTDEPTGPFLTINGAEIHEIYLIMNIMWLSLSLFVVWPLVVLNLRRLYRRYLDNPKRLHALRVEWAHITAASVFATVGSIDASYIYFDASRFMRDIAVAEYTVVLMNLVLFYFFSHLETYMLAVKLHIPPALRRTKKRWMTVNLVVANILLFVLMVSERAFLSGLMHSWVVAQLIVLGPVLWFLSWRVTLQVEEMYRDFARISGKKRENMKRFRRFAIISSILMMLIGLILSVFFAGRFQFPPDCTTADVGWADRLNKNRFVVDYQFVITFPLLFYCIKLFWVTKHAPTTHDPNSGSPTGKSSSDPTSCRTDATGGVSKSKVSNHHDIETHDGHHSPFSEQPPPMSIPSHYSGLSHGINSPLNAHVLGAGMSGQGVGSHGHGLNGQGRHHMFPTYGTSDNGSIPEEEYLGNIVHRTSSRLRFSSDTSEHEHKGDFGQRKHPFADDMYTHNGISHDTHMLFASGVGHHQPDALVHSSPSSFASTDRTLDSVRERRSLSNDMLQLSPPAQHSAAPSHPPPLSALLQSPLPPHPSSPHRFSNSSNAQLSPPFGPPQGAADRSRPPSLPRSASTSVSRSLPNSHRQRSPHRPVPVPPPNKPLLASPTANNSNSVASLAAATGDAYLRVSNSSSVSVTPSAGGEPPPRGSNSMMIAPPPLEPLGQRPNSI